MRGFSCNVFVLEDLAKMSQVFLAILDRLLKVGWKVVTKILGFPSFSSEVCLGGRLGFPSFQARTQASMISVRGYPLIRKYAAL